MNRRAGIFWISVVGVVVGMAYWQLLDGNQVFAHALPLCCNQGQCELTLCTALSSANIKPGCDGVSITCQQCVNYTRAQLICFGRGSAYVSRQVASITRGHLATARKRFMKAHGRVFWVLGMMQRFWYSNDARRERFVTMCKDPDVQMLTWQAYMHKKLVKAKPMAHMRIFVKDMAHLLGMVPP